MYSLVAMYPHLGGRVLTWGRRDLTWGRTQSHLGATRPRVGIVKLGLDAPTWQYNDESGACFVFACQGIEPCQANADAGTRRPQVRTRFPQVRTRFPQVRTHFLLACAGQINEKINVRLMKINVQNQLAKPV